MVIMRIEQNAPYLLARGVSYCFQSGVVLLLVALQLLNVDSVLHCLTLSDRRLGEVLTATKLLQYTGTLILSLKLLESALDVLALFYRHNNHCSNCFLLFLFCLILWFCGGYPTAGGACDYSLKSCLPSDVTWAVARQIEDRAQYALPHLR